MDTLTNLEITILRILEPRQGRDNAISRASLVEAVNLDRPLFSVQNLGVGFTPLEKTGRPALSNGVNEREIRRTIKHLTTQHGVAIGSKGGKNGGYYICETADEVDKVAKYFDGIGLSSLFTSSKLRKIEMRDYLGQLSMKFSQLP